MNTSCDTNTVTLENFGFSNFEGESWKTIYGIDVKTVQKIRRGKTWKHIG